MSYKKWHETAVEKAGAVSELQLYFRVLILGLLIFFGVFSYINWLGIPGVLNKAVADTAIILIGLSMLLSGLCYFWDFVDSKIIYRKHLGLIGFAFAVAHIVLAYSVFTSLFTLDGWVDSQNLKFSTAGLATIIFSIMALISNRYAAHKLGGQLWRVILRTGYIGVILIWFHVVLLRYSRWVSWYENGMTTPPSMSLIVAVFMTIVVGMRIALWWSLRKS